VFYDYDAPAPNPRAKKAAPLDAVTVSSRLWAAARAQGYDLNEWAVNRADMQRVRDVIARAMTAPTPTAEGSDDATQDLSDLTRRRTLPKLIAKSLLRVIPPKNDKRGLDYVFVTESGTVYATDGYRAFVAPHLFGTPPGLDARIDAALAIPRSIIREAASGAETITLGSRRVSAGDKVERYGSVPGPDIDAVTPTPQSLTITLRADVKALLKMLEEAEGKQQEVSVTYGPYLTVNEVEGKAYPYVYHRNDEGRLKVTEIPASVMEPVPAPTWEAYQYASLFSDFVKDALLYAKEAKIKHVTFSFMDAELTPAVVRAEGDPTGAYSMIMPVRTK